MHASRRGTVIDDQCGLITKCIECFGGAGRRWLTGAISTGRRQRPASSLDDFQRQWVIGHAQADATGSSRDLFRHPVDRVDDYREPAGPVTTRKTLNSRVEVTRESRELLYPGDQNWDRPVGRTTLGNIEPCDRFRQVDRRTDTINGVGREDDEFTVPEEFGCDGDDIRGR